MIQFSFENGSSASDSIKQPKCGRELSFRGRTLFVAEWGKGFLVFPMTAR
jgi:hypothetical protein